MAGRRISFFRISPLRFGFGLASIFTGLLHLWYVFFAKSDSIFLLVSLLSIFMAGLSGKRKFIVSSLFIAVGNLSVLLYMNAMSPAEFTADYLSVFLFTTAVWPGMLQGHPFFRRRADPLTNVMADKFFLDVLNRESIKAKQSGKPYSFFYLDVDHLKTLNETAGENEGDDLLCTVVTVFEKNIRSHDVIARLGADEFGLLMPETNEREANIICERILQMLRDIIGLKQWPVTVSASLLTVLKKGLNALDIIELSEKTLKEIKKSGKSGKISRTV